MRRIDHAQQHTIRNWRLFTVLAATAVLTGVVMAPGIAWAQNPSGSTTPSSSATDPQNGICQKNYNPFWGYDGRFSTIEAEPPADLLRNANVTLAGCFAWQTFLALSHSPSSGELVHDGKAGPTQWESWQTIDQVFPIETVPAACKFRGPDPPVVVSMVDGLTEQVRVQVSPGQTCLDVPIYDQDRRLVWREVQLDPTFVRSAATYKPGTNGFQFSTGARSTKSAWKFYDPVEDTNEGFYVRNVAINDGKTCTVEPMAMVAFHTAVKTDLFPGWVWMTFEHVENAPTLSSLQSPTTSSPPADGWTFYAHGSTCTANRECDVNGKPVSTQVVRKYSINQSIDMVNRYWTDLLPKDSVWRNYQLIGVQWSLGTDPVGTAKLANTVLETGCQESDCFGCHSGEGSVDRSFVFLHSHDAKSFPQTVPDASTQGTASTATTDTGMTTGLPTP